jgi:hypothetical protein
MTVPTAGAHLELPDGLIQYCGLPLDRIIIVTSQWGVKLPAGGFRLEYQGKRNFLRWWHPWLDEDEHQALVDSGTAISVSVRSEFHEGLHKRPLAPNKPRIWGSIWLLDLSTGLRPNRKYVWWYGDNDLDIRARRNHGGVILTKVEYEHVHPSTATFQSPELLAQTELDAATFEREHAYLLRISRLITTWRRRLRLEKKNSHATR